MKTFDKVFYSNRLFVAIFLKLRFWKKVTIEKVKIKNALFPHFFVKTKKSDIRLHFHHINEYAPEIFYKGKIKVSWWCMDGRMTEEIQEKLQEEILQEEQERELLYEELMSKNYDFEYGDVKY